MTEAATAKQTDPFSKTADRVLKDFQRAGAATEGTQSKDINVEKRKVTFKGFDPKMIRLDENIRKNLDTKTEDFLRLVESIRQHGILQSVLVEERVGDNGDLIHVCVEGHRRILAAIEIGMPAIPAMVKRYTSASSRTEEALAADMKEFLNPLDRAEAYFYLLETGKTVEEIAVTHDRDPLTVQRYLKMARWSDQVKALIRAHPSLFPAKYLLHSYVQRGVEGDLLLSAVQERIASADGSTKKTKKTRSRPTPEVDLNSKMLNLLLRKQGVNVSLRQAENEVVATLHFSPSVLKDFVEALQKIQSESESTSST